MEKISGPAVASDSGQNSPFPPAKPSKRWAKGEIPVWPPLNPFGSISDGGRLEVEPLLAYRVTN